MAAQQQRIKPNRYKKSGKGGIVLAVLVVFICVVVAGVGYLMYSYKQQAVTRLNQPVQQQQVDAPDPQPHEAVQTPHSAAQSKISTKPVEAVPLAKQEPYYTGEPDPDKSPAIRRQPGAGKGELAILVDDMGSSIQEARSLAAIGLPISFAIIPGLRADRQVAAIAAEMGIEILLHIPMQSKEYPKRRLESNGLLLEHDNDELRRRMQGYFEQVPGAVGANNHMGSGFTEYADRMRVVLGMLKERNLFFIDSITTPQTTGLQVAAELKMRKSRRDVFLDNQQEEGYIRGQLAQAVVKARKNGQALAICHPHPTTISTLSKALPELKQQGITLVPVSKLVR